MWEGGVGGGSVVWAPVGDLKRVAAGDAAHQRTSERASWQHKCGSFSRCCNAAFHMVWNSVPRGGCDAASNGFQDGSLKEPPSTIIPPLSLTH